MTNVAAMIRAALADIGVPPLSDSSQTMSAARRALGADDVERNRKKRNGTEAVFPD